MVSEAKRRVSVLLDREDIETIERIAMSTPGDDKDLPITQRSLSGVCRYLIKQAIASWKEYNSAI